MRVFVNGNNVKMNKQGSWMIIFHDYNEILSTEGGVSVRIILL